MKKIYLITGGQRSGKSVYAEKLALSLSDNPVYMATAHIWDEEFRERVRIHQERRGPQWTNIEEEKYLSKHDVTGRVVLVDCCTLWLTNWGFSPQPSLYKGKVTSENKNDNGDGFSNPSQLLQKIQAEFDSFTSQDATFIFVTNEIGLGGTSPNALQRHFTDLLGMLNQHIASKADEVVLMVSGIPVKIK